MRRSDHGAAAVEFALVSLVLFPLILGMIQYGLYFNDSLQARQATRVGARTGVVGAAVTCPTATTSDAQKLACWTKTQLAPVSGKAAVMVKSTGTTTTPWARGQILYVCAVVASASANAGLIPVPNGGTIRSVTAMAIEKDSTTDVTFTNPTGYPTGASAADTPDPSGGSWTWCQ